MRGSSRSSCLLLPYFFAFAFLCLHAEAAFAVETESKGEFINLERPDTYLGKTLGFLAGMKRDFFPNLFKSHGMSGDPIRVPLNAKVPCLSRFACLAKYNLIKGSDLYFLTHPGDITKVQNAKSERTQLRKGWIAEMVARVLAGTGSPFLETDDPLWKALHDSSYTRFFSPHRLQTEHFDEIGGHVDWFLTRIEEKLRKRASDGVDLQHEALHWGTRATLDVFLDAQLSDGEIVTTAHHMEVLSDYIDERLRDPLALLFGEEWNKRHRPEVVQAERHLLELAVKLVSDDIRREESGEPANQHRDIKLIRSLIKATEAPQSISPHSQQTLKLTVEQALDQIRTIIFVGPDTFNILPSAAIYALWDPNHSGIRQKLMDEIRVVGGTSDLFNERMLLEMRYLDAFVKELQRLCVSFGFIREAKEDIKLRRGAIPAGSLIFIGNHFTHRLPAFWKDPEVFDPERFLVDDPARPPYAFMPFGFGPRICAGQHFATLATKIFIVKLMFKIMEFEDSKGQRGFDFDLTKEADGIVRYRGALRFMQGLPAVLRTEPRLQ